MVPYVRPLRIAQSSTTTTRGGSGSGRGSPRTRRSTVSALAGMASRGNSLALAPPPSAAPARPWASASRGVRRARSATNSGKCSAKVRRAQPGLRQ